jgi:hypothetical protein
MQLLKVIFVKIVTHVNNFTNPHPHHLHLQMKKEHLRCRRRPP